MRTENEIIDMLKLLKEAHNYFKWMLDVNIELRSKVRILREENEQLRKKLIDRGSLFVKKLEEVIEPEEN